MTNILLMASLVLNFIALFSIVLLYLRQNRLLQMEKKQERIMEEMEEFFSGCILEFKEENERFISKLKDLEINKEETGPPRQVSSEQEVHQADHADHAEKAQNRTSEHFSGDLACEKKKTAENLNRPAGNVFQAAQAYAAAPKPEKEKEKAIYTSVMPQVPDRREIKERPKYQKDLNSSNLYIQSLLNQALLLKKQGLSLEEIAKKLNKGKTEIELLFKFRQKN